jgi:hypothetical protein
LVKKWIPPSRSEIAEIGQKKPEGILGVKHPYILLFKLYLLPHAIS